MQRLGEILIDGGVISQAKLDEALALQQRDPAPLGVILAELGFATEEQVVSALCGQLSPAFRAQALDAFDGGRVSPQTTVPERVLAVVPPKVAVQSRAMPIRFDTGTGALVVAMCDVNDHHALNDLQLATSRNVKPIPASLADLKALWKRYYNIEDSSASKKEVDLSARLMAGVEHQMNEHSIVELVNTILGQGIAAGASDIHLDLFDEDITVRYRIDGILYTALRIPVALYKKLVSRIKVVANLDISEKRLTQEGRLSARSPDGTPLEFRVSVLPVYNAERIAIRLMDKRSYSLDIHQLGFAARDLEELKKELDKSYGMILVTGPTGSGKTTTLYSMINYLNDMSRNIIAIEDPVEVGMKGVAQVQIDARSGHTFASVLRSVLRQDPNVIMVGEIRDEETAQLCIRASMTGHLVLATVHTSDAATAVARLKNFGIKPYLLASSLNLVIAQRLVRRLCPECGEPDRVDPRELIRMGLPPREVERFTFKRSAGCDACNSTGYRGRVGLFEVMRLSQKIKDLVAEEVPAERLKRRAIRDGMVSLNRCGLLWAGRGLTSVDEVARQAHHQA